CGSFPSYRRCTRPGESGTSTGFLSLLCLESGVSDSKASPPPFRGCPSGTEHAECSRECHKCVSEEPDLVAGTREGTVPYLDCRLHPRAIYEKQRQARDVRMPVVCAPIRPT